MARRSQVIERDVVSSYHVYAKVVRGQYLLENEEFKGMSIARLMFLLEYFLIQCIAETVMDNHWHLVLVIRPDVVEELSDEEVLRRARAVFPSYFEKQGLAAGDPLPRAWLRRKGVIREMRRRLCDISWLIHRLNGHLAIEINEALDATGPVFEPFKCQRLLDEFALLACCIYVDLNYVRARKAETPEQSRYTSVWYRIQALKARKAGDWEEARRLDQWLTPIHHEGDHENYGSEGKRATEAGCLEIALDDYLTLLDQRGREEDPRKRGKIPSHLPPILERIGATAEQLLEAAERFPEFRSSVGRPESIRQEARRRYQRSLQGVSVADQILGESRAE